MVCKCMQGDDHQNTVSLAAESSSKTIHFAKVEGSYLNYQHFYQSLVFGTVQ